MTSIYAAIVTALGIVLFLRKAWYNYTRLPKIPYVIGLDARDRAGVMHRMESLVGHTPTAKAAIEPARTSVLASSTACSMSCG